MVNYCCVRKCRTTGPKDNVSLFGFPTDDMDEELLKVWKKQILRPNCEIPKNTKICSKHFTKEDFDDRVRRLRLRKTAVPSIFPWTTGDFITVKSLPTNCRFDNSDSTDTNTTKRRLDVSDDFVDSEETGTKRCRIDGSNQTKVMIDRLDQGDDVTTQRRLSETDETYRMKGLTDNSNMTTHCADESDATDTASEGEYTVHAEVQVDMQLTCSHRFSMATIVSSNPRLKLIRFYTGFASYEIFNIVLHFVVPGKDRSSIVYCNSDLNQSFTSRADHFGSEDDAIVDIDSSNGGTANDWSNREHELSVEDEFLLTLMKLKLGLFDQDLAVRFQISPSAVSTIFRTWINLMYQRLRSLKIFPHRDFTCKNMNAEFKEQYPRVMLIVDCIKLKIKMASTRQSEYRTRNKFKCLAGFDSNGGIMFVSDLYSADTSEKTICQQNGFFHLLQSKIQNGELRKDDAVLADKEFNVASELHELGLRLNVSPKLETRDIQGFQVSVNHRIYVDKAIGKVRNCHIFERTFPTESLGLVNQIWTVCCILVNVQDSSTSDIA